jgi:hypothetical protein
VLLVGILVVCPLSVVRSQLFVKRTTGEQVSLEGVLEVLYEDQETEGHIRYFLKMPDGRPKRYSLQFAADMPPLQSGMHVRVAGVRVPGANTDHLTVRVDQFISLDSDRARIETLSATAPETFGEQRTAVLLVNFQDKPSEQPFTPDTAREVMARVSEFYLENSYRRTWLTSDVFGWVTIPLDSTVCDPAKIASSALQALAGTDLSAYKRLVYVFPKNACGWWGFGTIGGDPSQVWINGNFQLKVVAHELGHSLGLYHSRALDCGAAAIGADCNVIEYGDTLDIMGSPSPGHFNAFQKERLGWLDTSDSSFVTDVESDGSYSLGPYESAGSGTKALRILKAIDPTTGEKTWYYVEYRQAIGFDRFLSDNSNVRSGVILHTGSESVGDSSFLLDLTPETPPWSDPALVAGKSFYDREAEVTITVVSATREGATINVRFGRLPCVPANPTVELSPSHSQWGRPGGAFTSIVSVTNNDNPGCLASSFDLRTTIPTGLAATLADSAVIVNPGAMAMTMLHITSPSPAIEGVYPIIVTAANQVNSLHTASAPVTLVVASSFTTTVSTDQSNYTRPQWLSVTVQSSAFGVAISGASVILTVKKPNGVVITGVTMTRADGSAIIEFRLKEQDPIGVYQVRADASANGIPSSAATSFTVQ